MTSLVRRATIELMTGAVLLVSLRLILKLKSASALLVLALLVFALAYFVSGTAAIAKARGRNSGWGVLGLLFPVGTVLVALLPAREAASPAPYRALGFLKPAAWGAGLTLAVAAVAALAGAAIAPPLERRELTRWSTAFALAGPVAGTNEAAVRVERLARDAGIAFRSDVRGNAQESLGRFVRQIVASRSGLPTAPPDLASYMLVKKGAVREIATLLAANPPSWRTNGRTDVILGILDIHRHLVAAAAMDQASGNTADAARQLQAATVLTRAMASSGDFVSSIAAMRALTEEAAVGRRLRNAPASMSPGETKQLMVQTFAREVEWVAGAMRRETSTFAPRWLEPLSEPYLRLGAVDYQHAWREVLAERSDACRDGSPHPRFARWNIAARIASPDPAEAGRFLAAALAVELSGMTAAIRERASIPRTGIRSAVCSDVVWIVESSPERFSVTIDRPLVRNGRKEAETLSYEEVRGSKVTSPR